jgi:hypothetical protein
MQIRTITDNPLPGHFFEKDFDEVLGWLHMVREEVSKHAELDIEMLDKFVFYKHIAVLCKLKTNLTPAQVIDILSRMIKRYPGGYRPWFTYDHYSYELMVCAYPFYKGKLMEDQVKNGY